MGQKGGEVFAIGTSHSMPSCLDSRVLLLNAHYSALRVISVRRAFSLLFKRDLQHRPVAEVVSVEEGQYVSYDFEDWANVSALKKEFEHEQHDWIRTVRFDLLVPRIIRVLTFTKLPRQEIKFNRRNVFARDHNTCQYCGKKYTSSELSLDHVLPRSQGGLATWNNIVCACVKCNVRKGGRTPHQAGIHLIRAPEKPKRNPAVSVTLSDRRYSTWKTFLDAAYWDVELK